MAENDIVAFKELASGGFVERVLTPADIGAATTESTVAKAKALVDEFTGDPALIYTSEGSNGWTTLTDPASFRTALELSTNGNAAGLYDNTAGQVGAVVNDYSFRINGDGVSADFDTANLTASRAYGLPNASGTLALTSDFAAPPSIGSTTANAGSFTTLTASTSLTLGTSGILSGGTNTIEQRNTTSGQTFRIYNTVSGTNDANFERGFMRWSSNVLQIGTEKAGTGSARALEFQVDGSSYLDFNNGLVRIMNNRDLTWQARCRLRPLSTTSGVLGLLDDTGGNPSVRFCFEGFTSSFPCLKRSSTTLQVRLANDSAFAPFECAGLTLNGDLTASTRNIVTDTTTGTKIGTSTTQKIGFFDKTPVVQPTAVADATDAATVITQLNALLSRMRDLGLIAT